jgi:hypothetical protein
VLNVTNLASGSGAGLQLPSAATVTVAANGNFTGALGSVPSSFVAPQAPQVLGYIHSDCLVPDVIASYTTQNTHRMKHL